MLVKLAHIEPKDTDRGWTDNAKNLLNKYAFDDDKLKMTISEPSEPPIVVLFERLALMDLCLNAQLVASGFATSTGKKYVSQFLFLLKAFEFYK